MINSPQVNAFVVPGGKVVVYTGEGRPWGALAQPYLQPNLQRKSSSVFALALVPRRRAAPALGSASALSPCPAHGALWSLANAQLLPHLPRRAAAHGAL